MFITQKKVVLLQCDFVSRPEAHLKLNPKIRIKHEVHSRTGG